jgi:CheY-like chemotaxis protein
VLAIVIDDLSGAGFLNGAILGPNPAQQTPLHMREDAPSDPGRAVPLTADCKSKLILIIDDSVVLLKALSMKLGSRGYEVLTAANSASAISLMRANKPDLVILDVNFPTDSWDGFGLMAWFRRMDDTRNVPIIVISGSDSDNYEERCRQAGAVAFFLKPLDHDLLLTTLRQTLGQTPEEQAPVALPPEHSTVALEVEPDRPESILLVEDDKCLGETLEFFLQSEGFRVRRVSNGTEGLCEVVSSDFHIILSDMVMPNMSGDQFYQAVEKVKPYLCRRFIFMTGHQADPRSDSFIRRVRSFMLWKPFPLCDLLTAIGIVWKKARAQASPCVACSAESRPALSMAAQAS